MSVLKIFLVAVITILLQILIENKSAFAKYTCNASNSLGVLKQIFNLHEGIRPNPPEYVTVQGANAELLVIGVHPAETPKHTYDMKPNGIRIQYRPYEAKIAWHHADFPISQGKFYVY